MPTPGGDIIAYKKHARSFIQIDGPRPGNQPKFYGVDAQYMAIGDVTIPELGNITPTYVHHPYLAGQFILVGRGFAPPDLPSSQIQLYEKHGGIPRQLMRSGCLFNVYTPVGVCKDLSNLNEGGTDYTLVFARGITTQKTANARTSLNTDEPLEDTLQVQWGAVYPLGFITFGERGSTEVTANVLDICYYSDNVCGDCGVPDNGTSRIAAVTDGAVGVKPLIVYSTNGGATWTATQITAMQAEYDVEKPVAIRRMGDKIVIVTRTGGGATTGAYYYASITPLTGAIGAFTKVTGGFVSTFEPLDMTVVSAREAYISADAGYIYKLTDVGSAVTVIESGGATTANLSRIIAFEKTIAAVGVGGVVVLSTNGGTTFALMTTPVASDGKGIAVFDPYRLWTIHANGNAYYSIDGGNSWTAKSLPGAPTNTHDIKATTDEVLFAAVTAGGVAKLVTSLDGGFSWTNAGSRLGTIPSFNGVNRIAVPENASPDVVVNNLVMAGFKTTANADGIIVQGAATIL
jgi:photosystem II stability/assembly factor-like uncharacterized protein